MCWWNKAWMQMNWKYVYVHEYAAWVKIAIPSLRLCVFVRIEISWIDMKNGTWAEKLM